MSSTTSPPKLVSTKTLAPMKTALPVAPARRPKTTQDAVASAGAAKADASPFQPGELWNYGIDVWQRSVLFWDALRQRANIMMEHEEAGMPPVLTFQYETLLDGRRFNRPTNYALLRITTVGEEHAEDCIDETKPPVIVIDPRAGHGPGIGGFKDDSRVGVALRGGHPVYFVIFLPRAAARADPPRRVRSRTHLHQDGSPAPLAQPPTSDRGQLPGRLGRDDARGRRP